MRRGLVSIVALLGMLCVASASAKDRKTPAVDPERGAIGVTIQSRGPTAIASRPHASMAYFVKVDEGVDILNAAEIMPSNFSDDNQVYLLNAAPGKYVLVGAYTASYDAPTKGFNDIPSTSIYFDREMIPATEVVVEAGTIAFAGEIVVKVSASMKNADAAQTHYGALLGSGIGLKSKVNMNVTTGDVTSSIGIGHLTRAGTLQSLARDPKTEREFWSRAVKNVFEDEPDWQDLARRRLEPVD